MGKIFAFGFSFVLMIASAFAGTADTNALMHRRLIWAEKPQNCAVVCWDTATEGTSDRVYYDTESRKAVLKDYRSSQVCTANGSYTWTPVKKKGETNSVPYTPDLYYHHARLTGLKPGTTYYFVMASGDALSEEFHFKTAPATDEPIKLIFGADSRTGIAARRQLNALIAKMAEEDETIIAFAHGGDYVADGLNLDGWKSWLKDHELTITASRRMLPLIPARGNHESKGQLYDQVLGFPGGQGKNYFASLLSPEILFVTLNTETKADGEQKAFLEATLSEAGASRWQVIQYHRPVYPAVKKSPDAGLEHWVPLFEKYNVPLVCEADGHCIKRTLPIRNGKPDPTGVIYIGEGGFGAEQRTPNPDLWYLQSPGMVSKGDHFQILSFTKTQLAIDVINSAGKNLDSYKILAVQGILHASEQHARPLVHPLFCDHAVLQRDVKVPVWGWAAPGSQVTVRFAKQEKSAIADPDGTWRAYLDPMPACAKPQHLRVSTINHPALTINDVLVGDVWLCSGQSNMEMGMGMCNVSNEIARAKFPLIRLLTVPHKISFEPEKTLSCAWLPCSPTSLLQGGWGGFSAAGYFFGRELHQELNVPIALIQSAWGGTVCEAWTSREALKPLGDFKADLERVEQVLSSPGPDKLGTAMAAWYQKNDPGTIKEWFKPETDVSAWKAAKLPANWGSCGLPGYEGIVWAQRTFELPFSWVSKELLLNLGVIADVDTTWINGVRVGRTDYFDQTRTYHVRPCSLNPGKNVITLRIVNTGGGGFLGKPDDLNIQPTRKRDAPLSLAGEWRIQETATRVSTGAALAGNPNISSVLYNGMIAPLLPFAIKGAIWYQGEANAERAAQYRTLLPVMIKDWSSRFGVGDFGFHIVSLANYKPVCAEPRDNDWAELREAQALTAKNIPNCGLAMAIDIGDAGDIHPKNKEEVGRRLALSALAVTYGKKIEWSGPWYKSMEICEQGIRLTFDHATSGLVAKGEKLTGFAIAGANGTCVWADAVIDGETVVVSSPAVPKPVAVRYGWDANPVCNLYNNAGLPAVPFRTDDWPRSREQANE